jgi:hypothetical protein
VARKASGRTMGGAVGDEVTTGGGGGGGDGP